MVTSATTTGSLSAREVMIFSRQCSGYQLRLSLSSRHSTTKLLAHPRKVAASLAAASVKYSRILHLTLSHHIEKEMKLLRKCYGVDIPCARS